ncbi:hypothetical protein DV738_g1655, partial [Chaetothyriales sp. CBS 135597]
MADIDATPHTSEAPRVTATTSIRESSAGTAQADTQESSFTESSRILDTPIEDSRPSHSPPHNASPSLGPPEGATMSQSPTIETKHNESVNTNELESRPDVVPAPAQIIDPPQAINEAADNESEVTGVKSFSPSQPSSSNSARETAASGEGGTIQLQTAKVEMAPPAKGPRPSKRRAKSYTLEDGTVVSGKGLGRGRPGIKRGPRGVKLEDASVASEGTESPPAPPTTKTPGSRQVSRKRKRTLSAASNAYSPQSSHTSDSRESSPEYNPTGTTRSGRVTQKPSSVVVQSSENAGTTPKRSKGPSATAGPNGVKTHRKIKRRVYRGREQLALCEHCLRGYGPDGNVIVFCDACNKCWHQRCHDPQKMAYLESLSRDELIRTILRASDLAPALALFKLPLPSLPAAKFHSTYTTPASATPIYHSAAHAAKADDGEDEGYETYVDEHALLYPRPGYGIKLPSEREDMHLLLESKDSRTFSHWVVGRKSGAEFSGSGDVRRTLALEDSTVMLALDNFFKHIHPIPVFSFLHKASIIQRYESGTVDTGLILSIIGIASQMTNLGPGMREYGAECIAAAEALVMRDISKPSVIKIQTLVLIIQHRKMCRRFTNAFMLLATAMRFAFALRLNHEASNLCFLAQESRRRLMWALYVLDSTLAGGVPDLVLCKPEALHIQLPCQERNFEFDLEQATEPLKPPRPKAPLADSVGSLGIYIRVMWIRARVVTATKEVLNTDEFDPMRLQRMVEGFTEELTDLRASLPASFQFSEKNLNLRAYSVRLCLQEGLSQDKIDRLDPRFINYCRWQCYENARAMSEIFRMYVALKSGLPSMDLEFHACAYQCARLLFHLYRSQGESLGLSKESATIQARYCLEAIEHLPMSTPAGDQMQEDLRKLIGRGASAELSETPPGVSVDANAPTGSSNMNSTRPSDVTSRQNYVSHNIVRQMHLLDDSESLAMPTRSNANVHNGHGTELDPIEIPVDALAANLSVEANQHQVAAASFAGQSAPPADHINFTAPNAFQGALDGYDIGLNTHSGDTFNWFSNVWDNADFQAGLQKQISVYEGSGPQTAADQSLDRGYRPLRSRQRAPARLPPLAEGQKGALSRVAPGQPCDMNEMAELVSSPRAADVEKQAQADDGKTVPQSPMLSHLTSPIRPSFATEILLLILTVMTGIQDATTFPDYHCFASNQTGNTIFLTLAVVTPKLNGKMFITENIAVALALFLAAGALTGQIGHLLSIQRSRLFLFGCNMLQTVLVFIAAGVQFVYGVHVSGTPSLVVVGLLAAASGSQVVQSRALSTTEISTAMATAAWVDLVIDPHLFQAHAPGGSRGRNRRAAFLLALVAGGFLGAVLYRFAGSPVAIAVSAAGKFVVSLGHYPMDDDSDDD